MTGDPKIPETEEKTSTNIWLLYGLLNLGMVVLVAIIVIIALKSGWIPNH